MAMSSSDSARDVESLVDAALDEFGPTQVWVGYSGGVDSTALLLAAERCVRHHAPPIRLHALHVDHGLQPDSAGWSEHCAQVCAALEVPFSSVRAEVSADGNMEANARAARYELFAERVRAGDLLLLGHHQRDQTETVLYRLFQGRGLTPMRARGAVGGGDFARPLLSLPRATLVEYVRAHDVDWVEDASNADTRLTRSFLRHDIIPRLSARWRDLDRAVRRVADLHGATATALEHTLAQLDDELDLADLPGRADALHAWLRAYLHSRGVYGVTDGALREFVRQLRGGGRAELAWGEARLYAHAQRLYFEPEHDAHDEPAAAIALGETLELPGGRLTLRAAAANAPFAFVYPGPLQVRTCPGSQRIAVAENRSKTLKELYREHRVPPWRRMRYPVLYSGDALVCLPGIAVSAEFAPGGAAGGHCVADWQVERAGGE